MKSYITFIIYAILLKLSAIYSHIITTIIKLFNYKMSSSMSDDNIMDHSSIEQETSEQIYKFIPFQIEKVRIRYRKSSSKHLIYPAPRSGHRIVCTDGNLYCLGGFNPEYQPLATRRRIHTTLFQELWQFNLATRKWKLCLNCHAEDMPIELASNAVAVKSNALFAYGGTSYPFGETSSNKCYIFFIDRRDVIVKRLQTRGNFPTPQYGPAIAIHNDYLYTIGGTTGFEYSCDVHRLNLKDNSWEKVYENTNSNDPKGRYRHEIVHNGNLVYILGGGTDSTSFDLDILPAFDLENKCWKYIKTLPDPILNIGPGPRKSHSCVQYNTDNGIEVVIAGGYGVDNKCFADIWKLNLDKMQWISLSNDSTSILPNPIYFHSAATPGNGCMYVFGGIEVRERLTRTNHLYKVWTTIPKLSEICWDSICFYNSRLDRYKRDELHQMGIPNKFISRIKDDDED